MQQQPAQSVHNASPHETTSPEDEIDLFELWTGLVEEKWTILLSVLIALVLAATYAFLGPKTYEVKVSFLPSFEKDVLNLNFGDVIKISAADLYQSFTDDLRSPSFSYELMANKLVQGLFEKNTPEDVVISSLQKSITPRFPEQGKQKMLINDLLLTEVSVQAHSSDNAMHLAKAVIAEALATTKDKLLDNLNKTIDIRLKDNLKQYELISIQVNDELNAEISRLKEIDFEERENILEEVKLLRSQSKQERLYTITRLDSDLKLAEKLGIHQPINPLDYQRKVSSSTLIDINKENPSRYWLGTEILGAEIQSLQNRKDDDAFIGHLVTLQTKLSALDVNVKINTILARENNAPFSQELRKLRVEQRYLEEAKSKIMSAPFEVVRVVREPIKPSGPIKPKKSLILAVAGVLGLMLGVFVASIRRAIKNRQAKAA